MATKQCIPCNDVSHKPRRVAGWTKHCSDLGLTSRFWHSIWVANGRPHDGAVAQIMRRTRSVYHAEVRRVMREEDQMRVNKMAQALFNNESSDLWKEVKRSRGTRKLPTTVQTATSPQEIVSLFKDHFASLYTSVDGSALSIADFARDVSAQYTRDD